MSQLSRAVENKKNNKRVVNFMGGYSYEVNPLDTLKMVTASSIFGEPQYYRNGMFSKAAISDGKYSIHELFQNYSVIDDKYEGKNTSEIMENVIDDALDYDFGETLSWAVALRNEFNMRLNPQIIMVRAAIHPKREEFTKNNPGKFNEINELVMRRVDEPISQFTYFLYKNGKKNNIPGILKRGWNRRLKNASAYELNKYKNSGIGMIDTIRVCHANNETIDELMKSGSVSVPESDLKWETLKAEGKTWREILDIITIDRFPHMALLRNLRGIFTEIEDLDLCKKVMEHLKSGVLNGKQFPFRYQTARDMILASNAYHKQFIADELEACMDIACENMPKLKGKTMCLSDNSGSAHGTFQSEYGKVSVAKIGNLSSVITAINSDEGYVGAFGDCLYVKPISKRDGLLSQTKMINDLSVKVGMGTENGVWLFFKNAIDKKEHWDNIVIYSDMQAGHGGLYGTDTERPKYAKRGFCVNHSYIDVAKLIEEYRKINPKVNVYCIQTAGYNNVLVPEYGYRTNLFYGWTGKELLFIDTMNRFWDEKDSASESENSLKRKPINQTKESSAN